MNHGHRDPSGRQGNAAASRGTRWVTPLADDPIHIEAISQSHERCNAFGLAAGSRPDYDPLGRPDLAVARERNLRLFDHAAPVMELLFDQVVNTHSMVVLTDAQGTILHSIGDNDFLEKAEKVALMPGVNWAEHTRGTNAIGTALIHEDATLVHAGEHFIRANHFLTCSAAPIFDPRGNILGILDVTGDHRSYHRHTMGLVKMSARMIENHWFSEHFAEGLRLHFHSRPEFIGTLLEGIVAVGRDGRILGANRAALDQLGCSGAALRARSLTSAFGTTVAALVDHFRSPLATVLPLSLPGGQQVYARCQVNWASAHWLGEPARTGAAAAAQADDAARAHEAAAASSPAPGTGEAPGAPAAGVGGEAAPRPRETVTGLRWLQTGDAQMGLVIDKLRRVIDRDIPILVLGETGTGKELVARAIHQDSARSRQPFVAVNCASIPETLIEAELFGYEEGAFTGARRRGATGKIVQANGGTLFLDEIGDMPLPLQARLLRVLQERQVTPLGSVKSVPVDVSVICATHRNLREMIARGEFREDLYYRLNGLVVKLPALRERSDLAAIVQRVMQSKWPGREMRLDAEVAAMFRRYHWPGNIRQLISVLHSASVMAGPDQLITAQHLSDDFLEDLRDPITAPAAAGAASGVSAAAPLAAPPGPATGAGAAAPAGSGLAPPPGTTLEAMEREVIRQAVEAAGGNISEASKRLGISRNTIYRKLRWNQG